MTGFNLYLVIYRIAVTLANQLVERTQEYGSGSCITYSRHKKFSKWGAPSSARK
jgi:hypothetical protein